MKFETLLNRSARKQSRKDSTLRALIILQDILLILFIYES